MHNSSDMPTTLDDEAQSTSLLLKSLFIVALLVYFLILVVARTPADVAAWAVNRAVPQLWFSSVQGTVWEGHAGGAQLDLGERVIPLGEVNWRLNPWSLLVLRPCLSFDSVAPGQMISGHFCQSPFGTTTARDINVDAPMAVINDLLPMETAGTLSLQVLSLDLSGKRVNSLDARFSWQQAAVHNGETWLPLGSFGGQARANGQGGIQAQIGDIEGPFGLDLTAGWVLGEQNWTANGTIEARDGAPDQVVQALSTFAEEVSPRNYKITWP